MSHVFFGINFGVAVMSLMASTYAIAVMESPGSFLGGIGVFGTATAFAVAEWLAWFRGQQEMLNVLAVVCISIGGFAVFGVVVNVVEALRDEWPPCFEWFVAIGLGIAAYFTFCGVYRLLLAKRPHDST